MKRVIWWIVFVIGLGGGGFLLGNTVPRFHRYAQSKLDAQTYLDLVKDVASGTCWLVYVAERPADNGRAISATTLGPVKCDPIPVPGAVPLPGSAVR